ncbi:MAG: Dabb family protein [Thermomicrobiales bacterium]
MIDHIVLIRPRAEIGADAISSLKTALAALPTSIAGIVSYAFGSNSSPEALDQGYALGFSFGFDSAASRDRYLIHPAHVAVVPLVQAVAENVLVFDLET